MEHVDEVRAFIAMQLDYINRRLPLIPRLRAEAREIEDADDRRDELATLDRDASQLPLFATRLRAYAPAPNGDHVCPDCLMRTGQSHSLRAAVTPDGEADAFQCPECRETYAVGDER
jgi:hypothetical protein